MTTPLFAPTLISPEVVAALPSGYVVRPMQQNDYDAGFLDVLRVLTSVGDISRETFDARYQFMASRPQEYFIVCIADSAGKIVAVGTLFIEKKFIRNCASVGHIEDIAVAADQQGKKLGLRIIQALDWIAEQMGCYKAILDCADKNQGFYEKCGYKLAGLEMAHYYDGSKSKDTPKKE